MDIGVISEITKSKTVNTSITLVFSAIHLQRQTTVWFHEQLTITHQTLLNQQTEQYRIAYFTE